MNSQSMFTMFLLLASVMAVSGRKLHTEDVTEQKRMWQDYKKDFDKSYSVEEVESVHFNHFVRNLKHIDELNEKSAATGKSDPAVFGLTAFTDQDVNSLFADATPREKKNEKEQQTAPHSRRLDDCDWTVGQTDWGSVWKDKITAVKNQEGCHGGHWAFAVAEQVESDARLASSSFTDVLSPQQLIDCATTNYGCVDPAVADSLSNGFTYLTTSGLQSNNHYPYTSSDGNDGTCSVSPPDEKVKVAAVYKDLADNEGCMISHLIWNGPLAVCLTVGTNFFHYTDGTLDAATCALPYDGDTSMKMVCGQITKVRRYLYYYPENNKYKFRASFGVNWGDAGFAKLALWENTCGVADMPMYTGVNIL